MSEVDRANVVALVATLESHIDHLYTPPHLKRDAHAKMHGCVQAVLTVREGLDAHLRQGLFAQPGRYLAWVRFSNAFRIQHDLEFETRGMAIKLLDVEGPGRALTATLESDADRRSQDFVLATYPAFFLPDMRVDYREFAEATARGQWAVVMFFLKHGLFRGGYAALRSAFVLARNPLAITYFSQTPYRFGDRAVVKIRARPWLTHDLRTSVASNLWFRLKAVVANVGLAMAQARGGTQTQAAGASIAPYVAASDFLRHAMMKTLSEGDARFEIEVQLQRAPIDAMPIDDATVRWPERLSRFQPVATLTIPRQVFWPEPGMPAAIQEATQRMMALGENMSFNPWHALEAHTPLGQINEARRRIYTAISTYRRNENAVDQALPTTAQYDDLKQIVQDGLPARPDLYEHVAS